jgi:elongation factor P
MPQINAGDFKKGVKILVDNEPYEMIDVHFVKPGKGQALYKTRLRHLLKGTIYDRTFKSGESMEGADVRKGDGQFLYKDSTGYVFMCKETFEQYTLAEEAVGDSAKFLQDGAICNLLYWNNAIIGMTPPAQVVMKVVYTEPAVRGNTSSSLTKPATVETGAIVAVPAFIEIGEIIKIDTATSAYLERIRE